MLKNCTNLVQNFKTLFQPEFAGKLNFYVNAVDDLLKPPARTPAIGLLRCSNIDSRNNHEKTIDICAMIWQTAHGILAHKKEAIVKQINAQAGSPSGRLVRFTTTCRTKMPGRTGGRESLSCLNGKSQVLPESE